MEEDVWLNSATSGFASMFAQSVASTFHTRSTSPASRAIVLALPSGITRTVMEVAIGSVPQYFSFFVRV